MSCQHFGLLDGLSNPHLWLVLTIAHLTPFSPFAVLFTFVVTGEHWCVLTLATLPPPSLLSPLPPVRRLFLRGEQNTTD